MCARNDCYSLKKIINSYLSFFGIFPVAMRYTPYIVTPIPNTLTNMAERKMKRSDLPLKNTGVPGFAVCASRCECERERERVREREREGGGGKEELGALYLGHNMIMYNK